MRSHKGPVFRPALCGEWTALSNVSCAVAAALRDCSYYHFEFRTAAVPGYLRWYSAHGQVVGDDQGHPVRMLGTHEDITQTRNAQEIQKQIENSLRETSGRLKQLSESMIARVEAERSRIARELHDEIGQVLAAISINLKVVQEKADPVFRARLEESGRSLTAARRMTTKLKSSSDGCLVFATPLLKEEGWLRIKKMSPFL